MGAIARAFLRRLHGLDSSAVRHYWFRFGIWCLKGMVSVVILSNPRRNVSCAWYRWRLPGRSELPANNEFVHLVTLAVAVRERSQPGDHRGLCP